ncbi:phosphotransferase [Nocardia sp. NPDC050435]|uniref:phosphotransferase family protein n=1 Tax=Nocardia sp. NPDC050435 TaxID=3155040 RepID=UPI003411AA0F
MLTPPTSLDDGAIARAVRAHWLPDLHEIKYLPWGFGAHHWQAIGAGTTLFVTLDQLEPRHTAASLEAAYAGAAALAAGSAAVCAPLPADTGRYTVAVGSEALSVTPWLDGHSPTEAEAAEPAHAREVIRVLNGLHRATPPAGIRRWTPQIGPDFADELAARTATTWTSGPLAEPARRALRARTAAVATWTRRYLELANSALTHRGSWVPTHGEPHHRNQVITGDGLKLVDWESLALAPPERDYADLGEAVESLRPDPAMVELFALDWRLAEIAEYARWFAAAHTGTDDDHTALQGLFEELDVNAGR